MDFQPQCGKCFALQSTWRYKVITRNSYLCKGCWGIVDEKQQDLLSPCEKSLCLLHLTVYEKQVDVFQRVEE